MSKHLSKVGAGQLDRLAADAGRVAGAAFAAAGWTWASGPGGVERVPDGVAIAINVRSMMEDLEMGHSRSSGRLTVYRAIEDGSDTEQFCVSLDLGTEYGDDA
jgi:hypothetical protein